MSSSYAANWGLEASGTALLLCFRQKKKLILKIQNISFKWLLSVQDSVEHCSVQANEDSKIGLCSLEFLVLILNKFHGVARIDSQDQKHWRNNLGGAELKEIISV